jgi:hypothetical protein
MSIKILIGTVTAQNKDYCWKDFKKQLLGLQKLGHDVLIVDNSDTIVNRPPFKTIHYTKGTLLRKKFDLINKQQKSKDNYLTIVTKDCMNIIRDEFLKGDYTHLFILESDVFLDKDFKSLDRLIELNADVANFTYPMKLTRNKGALSLCVQSTNAKGEAKMITPDESKTLLNQGVKVLNVDVHNDKTLTHCGYGCTLVKRRVLEAIDFKAVRTSNGVTPFPDSVFHYDVNKGNFYNVLDTDYIPYHCNINNETENYMKITQIRNNTTRRQRREQDKINKKIQKRG